MQSLDLSQCHWFIVSSIIRSSIQCYRSLKVFFQKFESPSSGSKHLCDVLKSKFISTFWKNSKVNLRLEAQLDCVDQSKQQTASKGKTPKCCSFKPSVATPTSTGSSSALSLRVTKGPRVVSEIPPSVPSGLQS